MQEEGARGQARIPFPRGFPNFRLKVKFLHCSRDRFQGNLRKTSITDLCIQTPCLGSQGAKYTDWIRAKCITMQDYLLLNLMKVRPAFAFLMPSLWLFSDY